MKKGKKGIAVIVAAAMMLLSANIFVTSQKTVYAEETTEEGHLILENLEWRSEIDKNNLSPGDKFDVIATMKNNRSETMTINPAMSEIGWICPDYAEENGGWPPHLGYDGTGEKIVVEPGETKEVIFHREITRYEVPGRRTFWFLKIGTVEGYTIEYINSSDVGAGALVGQVQNEYGFPEVVHQLAYKGCLEYAVPNALEPDITAPFIRSMTTKAETVQPDKTVTYELDFGDYGYAPPEAIWVRFRDADNSEADLIELSAWIRYSNELETYTATLEFLDLESPLPEGTYRVEQVLVRDEAGFMRFYERFGEELLDVFGENPFTVADLVVAEASYTSGDINGDGTINMSDVMLCLNHYVEKAKLEGEQFSAADVDSSGEIEMGDVIRIMNYVVEKTQVI